jgi:hypothetical protein
MSKEIDLEDGTGATSGRIINALLLDRFACVQ